MQRAIATAVLIAMIAIPFACTIDAGNSDEPVSEASSLANPGDDITPAATNCTQVDFCNAPGPNGAQCRQRACSFSAAVAECRVDTPFVCGKNFPLPWVIIDSGGSSHTISDSCRLSGCPSTTRSGCTCDHNCRIRDNCCFDGPCS
jgi:hypothetical protein